MSLQHTETYHRLLESVSHYASKSLGLLDYGAGDMPQWTDHIISTVRTHLKDVTHFLRGQDRHGVRYGGTPHGRAYMATKNLREILDYAQESLGHMSEDAGQFPAWVENKISICAEYMDLIGHWIDNERIEGRRYGTHLHPTPGDAGNVAIYQGRIDGIRGEHKNPYSPNDFRHDIYEQGFSEGFGGRPRGYGAKGGSGAGQVGRGVGGTKGPAGRGRPGGRRSGPGPRRAHRGAGMGRGRGRHRRHRRHGVHIYPYWNIPYVVYNPVVYYPEYIDERPTIEAIVPSIIGNRASIAFKGYGFSSISGDSLKIKLRWEAAGSSTREEWVKIVNRSNNHLEVVFSISKGMNNNLEVVDVGYISNSGHLVQLTGSFAMSNSGKRFSQITGMHPGDVYGFQYQSGYGSAMAAGPATTSYQPSHMERMAPFNRMVEPHRQGVLHRQMGHQTGRRFGVPGFAPGTPGWAGQAGVAQIPHPTRGMASRPTPMGVQTYGSLGYASMGDGSMDMAVRGARRFAALPPAPKKRKKTKRHRSKRRRSR